MWEDFLKRHVLDPSVDGEYLYWNRERWNEWLRSRLPGDYGSKNVNSVIIKSPQGILDDFSQPVHNYSREHFWWSNSKFQTYVLKKTYKNDYDVINVGEMYVLVKLDDENRPVHFHAQYMDRIKSGNANISFSQYPTIS